MNASLKYIDVHGHINFPVFDADREHVYENARSKGVGMVSVGTDLATSKRAVELAEQYGDMWATVGMHPVFAGESHNDQSETGKVGKELRPKQEFDKDSFSTLAKHPKVVAIGECGLDYLHSKPEDISRQVEIFQDQIELANSVSKPLMLHVRNGKDGKSAYLEAVSMLKERSRVKANFHFFAGNKEDLKAITDIGCSVSFTGVITFARDYDDLIRYVPKENIMLETDCPYVAPVPFRGKRNEPSYVTEVAKKIAEIRGEDLESTRIRLLENSLSFFAL